MKVRMFWEGHKILTLLLSTVHTDKSKVKISQNFVAFSEYMNFNRETEIPDIPEILISGILTIYFLTPVAVPDRVSISEFWV